MTLWTAAWCPSCAIVRPLLRELIEIEGVGEAEGGVAYSEVELDSALIGDLGVTYMVGQNLREVQNCASQLTARVR